MFIVFSLLFWAGCLFDDDSSKGSKDLETAFSDSVKASIADSVKGVVTDSIERVLKDSLNANVRDSIVNALTDSIVGAIADSALTKEFGRLVELYLPDYDTTSTGPGRGKKRAKELWSQGSVDEKGEKVRYKIYGQSFGYWNDSLEVKWNYFIIQSFYYFRDYLKEVKNTGTDAVALYKPISEQDRFTRYITPEDAEALWAGVTTSTRNGVIGLIPGLVETGDTLRVRVVAKNSPASAGGIQKNDRIVAVNGISVVDSLGLAQWGTLTAGDSGTAVTLTVYREGSVFDVALVKGVADFPSVLVDTLENHALISIFSFTQNTYDNLSTSKELKLALEETRNFPVTLLDLRGNGGGSLSEVITMCDEIVSSGVMIQSEERGLNKKNIPEYSTELYNAEKAGVGEGRKYVLLGNGRSASASEIFISCLMEAEKVPLVGQVTYGKGIGQLLLSSPAGGIAYLTTLLFTSRSGDIYHKKGIVPTYPVADSLTLKKALDVATEMVTGVIAKRANDPLRIKRLNSWQFQGEEWKSQGQELYEIKTIKELLGR